ncbi:MAG TPA: class I SAM-dependent methyltransferase [Casimicrobiaceae bacterium]|jgi:SAM-dependent methyltransferase
MSSELQFTGERFVPGVPGGIAHEHRHRYAFARRFVGGRSVADVACGEGYGSALLGESAASVVGVDIDAATIAHAQERHSGPRVRFTVGSAAQLPIADASIDVVVSFETIEHLPADAQPAMLREFARVLKPDGLLVLSSPNRPEYSEATGFRNPFHLHELDRAELRELLDVHFGAQQWFRQRRYLGSALWAEDRADGYEAFAGDDRHTADATLPEAMYFIVVAARRAEALPVARGLSLLTDADDAEWRRLDDEAREVLRLDGLLKDRDAALDRQTGHIRHLETLVAERDRVIEGHDAVLRTHLEAVSACRTELGSVRQRAEALEVERQRLDRAVAAQERIIAYRQSVRWWLQLPWLRMRALWRRLT